MYNIREVKLQNQQDCFSYLYLFLAKECMACFGREGEEIIRPAIRNYGYSLGSQAKERLQKKGKRANLKTLVEEGSDTFTDPRFCFHPLCGTEQVFQLETYICPMALIWKKKRQSTSEPVSARNTTPDILPDTVRMRHRQTYQKC